MSATSASPMSSGIATFPEPEPMTASMKCGTEGAYKSLGASMCAPRGDLLDMEQIHQPVAHVKDPCNRRLVTDAGGAPAGRAWRIAGL